MPMPRSFLLVALLIVPLSAEAAWGWKMGSTWVSAGATVGADGADGEESHGHVGTEVTAGHYIGLRGWALGGFAQTQWTFDVGPRFAAGGQVNKEWAGLELGGAVQLRTNGQPPSVAIQIAPFISVGVVSLSLRVGIPVRLDREPVWVGANLAVKFPWTFA